MESSTWTCQSCGSAVPVAHTFARSTVPAPAGTVTVSRRTLSSLSRATDRPVSGTLRRTSSLPPAERVRDSSDVAPVRARSVAAENSLPDRRDCTEKYPPPPVGA